jgi:hypothetical protein
MKQHKPSYLILANLINKQIHEKRNQIRKERQNETKKIYEITREQNERGKRNKEKVNITKFLRLKCSWS